MLIVLGLSTLIAVVVLVRGRVSGIEFSPTHFQTRRFQYHELPGLRLQITPIRRDAVAIDAATYLTQNQFVTVPPGRPTRWDIVRLTRGGITLEDDAALLTDLLQIENLPPAKPSPDPFWQTWSADHPRSAARLWPTVQTLAIKHQYTHLPELLETASANTLEDDDNQRRSLSGQRQTPADVFQGKQGLKERQGDPGRTSLSENDVDNLP